MPDAENKSWTFLKGVGGTAGAVISAVLIYYFTRPAAPVAAPAAVAPVALEGVVADADSHKLIAAAEVSVALGVNTVHQLTDDLGRYSVVLAAQGPAANMGNVSITAPGYQAYGNSVELQPGQNFAEITIDPLSLPAAAEDLPLPATKDIHHSHAAIAFHPATPTPAPHQPAAIRLKPAPANFIKPATTAYAGVPHP